MIAVVVGSPLTFSGHKERKHKSPTSRQRLNSTDPSSSYAQSSVAGEALEFYCRIRSGSQDRTYSFMCFTIFLKEKIVPEKSWYHKRKFADKFPSNSKLNSCLVTQYENGSCSCPPHGDNELFISPGLDIFTFSIGASRTMEFESCSDHANQINESVKLKTNDLISFSLNSQDFYHRSIIPDETVNQPRFSLTFRSLAHYNLNYLAIIGDSNTQDLVFGEAKGKLGRWMPGSNFKASRIKNIPDPHTIGPCPNMLINVEVNEIPGDNPKSADFLSTLYEGKVK